MKGNKWTKDVDGNPMLFPYSEKKTLLGVGGYGGEMTAMWIEGANIPNIPKPTGFSNAGHPMWTNSGLYLTKEQLLEIVNQMPPIAQLCVASMTYPAKSTIEDINEKFMEDNSKILVYRNRIAHQAVLDIYPIKPEEAEWMERNKHLIW